MFPAIVKRTLDLHVFPNLAFATTIFICFDMWMFKDDVKTFVFVMNFLNQSWTPKHVIVSLFEMNETNGQNMVIQLDSLLSKFGLMHNLSAYVKEKGNNLTTTTSTLCSIIDFEPLRFIKVHEGTCFKHVMFKACQYTINDNKVSEGLMSMNVKDAQATL